MSVSPMLESFAHDCVMMDKRTTPDEEGGFTVGYVEGAQFTVYPSLDSSMQARYAAKGGVTSLYTVLIPQSAPIMVGDYYKDLTEDAYFRVTSRPDEQQTPGTSELDLKSFTAERTELPK